MGETMNKTEFEKSPEYEAIYLGTLGDFGLGNENGIPSRLEGASNEELEAYGKMLVENLTPVTNRRCLSCIDGRHVVCNHDGTEAEARLRHVGGTASSTGVAYNSDAPVTKRIDPNLPLGKKVEAIDDVVAEGDDGFDPCAHEGICGGANGEVADNRAIAEVPAVLGTAEKLMSVPAVEAYLETSFDADSAERVRHNAAQTADMLEAEGWNGQAYVDGVAKRNPHGVEDLEDDHEHAFHGHKEDAVAFIVGEETLTIDDVFAVSFESIMRTAKQLAEGDPVVYRKAVIADLAKHAAVTTRLPGKSTPAYLLIKKAA